MRYSLKGPFLSERLTESFYEIQYKKAEKFVEDFLSGREKKLKKIQKEVKKFLESSKQVNQFDMKNPRHQELFIQECANKMFEIALRQSINSIKKDLNKNPNHTLIVDLLGFSVPVKAYVKSEISTYIKREGVSGHKAQNIVWID